MADRPQHDDLRYVGTVEGIRVSVAIGGDKIPRVALQFEVVGEGVIDPPFATLSGAGALVLGERLKAAEKLVFALTPEEGIA